MNYLGNTELFIEDLVAALDKRCRDNAEDWKVRVDDTTTIVTWQMAKRNEFIEVRIEHTEAKLEVIQLITHSNAEHTGVDTTEVGHYVANASHLMLLTTEDITKLVDNLYEKLRVVAHTMSRRIRDKELYELYRKGWQRVDWW